MVSVIIPAAGSGTRFGGEMPKQFLPLNGMPVLARTAAAFQGIDEVGEIAVAVPAGYFDITKKMIATYGLHKVRHIVEGRASRSESVFEALNGLSPHTEIVLIHDGVRPLVSQVLIKKVVNAVRLHGAAVAGTVFTDTVKEAEPDGRICATPERGRFWQVQTPQGFTYEILMEAYRNAADVSAFTDDSALAEAGGHAVFIVEGERENIKITTPYDLLVAGCLLREKGESRP